ncbi:helix-turn-helix domain-containing protein [Veillonella nakazawae]|jgi:hypothetical protein|uniref:HTH cro/C1-type domain-containing protein n=1 Tax=Veillonella nakazawae TaxID=2682456 RepID=A0ABN5XLI7_9FIRM|nr:helix-turn-helix transcriptional regulator [Veillonella nakazawae]MBF1188561.1 helix-turn-helix transcriptional regulator [[Eubacterium] sulci]BBU33733.1 hypothetical protein VEIT17_01790 [Veillonella nakazawae]
MKVNCNGFWKILINKNINKQDLAEKVSLVPATIAKMSKDEFVSMEILYRIFISLGTDFGEIILIVEEKK